MTEFLRPAFDIAKADYLAKLVDIAARPLNDQHRAGIEKMALAIKVLNEVEQQIVAVIADGKAAQADAARAAEIIRLSPEERKYASY